MKTQMSRFHIHDDLSAPGGLAARAQGRAVLGRAAPELPRRPRRVPAALRGYARFRSELRNGTLPQPTLERIALAIAEHFRSEPGLAIHKRTARQAGLGIDEVALAREWDSATRTRPRCCAISRRSSSTGPGSDAPARGGPRGRLERRAAARSHRAGDSGSFTAMVNVAGEVPVDGSFEETRVLRAA